MFFHFHALVADALAVARIVFFDHPAAQAAVTRVSRRVEIHVAVAGHVRVVFLLQQAHDFNHFRDVLGGARVQRRGQHVQRLHHRVKFSDVVFRQLSPVALLGVGAADDLVVDVGEIRDELNAVAAVFQIAPHDVRRDRRTRVAQMQRVVNRRPADVHAHALAGRIDRLEFLFLTGLGVENAEHGREKDS